MKKLLSVVLMLALVGTCAFAKKKAKAAPVNGEIPADYVEAVMPEGEVTLLDDFEDGLYFDACKSTWENSINCGLSTEWKTSGANSMKCEYKLTAPEWQMSVFQCNSPVETDWTGAKYVTYKAYNPNSFCIPVGLVTMSGEEWKWVQTDSIILPPGEHLIVCDASTIAFPDNVLSLCIVQMGAVEEAGAFYVDDINLVR